VLLVEINVILAKGIGGADGQHKKESRRGQKAKAKQRETKEKKQLGQ